MSKPEREQSMLLVTNAERIFLEVVRGLRGIGYGRMLQIVSHEWWHATEYEDGVFVANTTLGSMAAHERAAFEEMATLDPLFAER